MSNESTHNNNIVFKKALLLTGIRDKDFIIEIFKMGGEEVSRSQYEKYKTINNPNAVEMPDIKLQAFFEGLLQLAIKGEITVSLSSRGYHE